jgi:hypothetical protein
LEQTIATLTNINPATLVGRITEAALAAGKERAGISAAVA